MKTIFILNSSVRRANQYEKDIHAKVNHEFEIWKTDYAGHAKELASQACDRCDFLVSVGGDGTLNEIVNGCMSAEGEVPVLGVVAAGTANDFVRTLKLSGSLDELLELIEMKSWQTIDIAQGQYTVEGGGLESRFFVNVADVGIGAAIVKGVKKYPRFLGSDLVYNLATIFTLLTYRAKMTEIKVNGHRTWSGKSILLAICNGKFFGSGLGISPSATLEDGELSLTIIGEVGAFQFLAHLNALQESREISHAEITYLQGSELEVSCEPAAGVELDGEFLGVTPAKFKVSGTRLRMLC